ncbi:cobalt-precorrin-6A reductase [Rhizobium sp. LjRoot254]|uniref:cobalt-precorrin-6A reductase n=1 Tax=Rhizobium sp. LjRoot254 TaxID=3342297 RepID=UPI003F500F48
MGKHRILILSGTTEARQLAERLALRADIEATISLAGRTVDPKPLPLPTRVGGFGGADGLVDYLANERIDLLIDATHPFANRISANAATASERSGPPVFGLCRPGWERQEGDRWISVADVAGAVKALDGASRRVFLAIGRQEAGQFSAMPQHAYLVRSVDPVVPPLEVPDCRYILASGPFDAGDETRLLHENNIAVVVSKNSGGAATYAKIAAARALGIKVVMIERQKPAGTRTVGTVEAALELIDQILPPA